MRTDVATAADTLWRAREAVYEGYAQPVDGAIVVRLDGRAFHTLTRGMEKPFDRRMTAAMEAAARSAAAAVNGCFLAYWQSDEISLAFANMSPNRHMGDPSEGLPFGGRVEKLVSVLASAASVGFVRAFPDAPGTPCFDGRVLVADTPGQLGEYLAWRIADSRKNAVSAAAHAVFGHKPLLNVGTPQRREMLVGTQWEHIPDEDYHGRIIAREESVEPTSWTDNAGVKHDVMATRHRWVTRAATNEAVSELVTRLEEQLAASVS